MGLPPKSCSRGSEQPWRADHVSHDVTNAARSHAYLEVDVLQSAHDHAVGRVLRNLQALPLLQAVDVDRCAHKLGVQRTLVGEALDVLGCMGVDVLQGASKLVVEPLHERDNAAGDLEELALLDDGGLLVVLPLLSALDNNNLLAVLEDLEKLAKLLVGTV